MAILHDMSVISGMAIAISLLLPASGAASPAPDGPASKTSARWEVDYGETRCRLIRRFGTESGGGRLEIAPDWSFGGYTWILVGTNIPVYSSETPVTVTLKPSLAVHRFRANPYILDPSSAKGFGWNDTDNRLADALRNDQQISVTGAKKLNVTLDLPNASSALKALEACDDDLIARWGFDARQQRSLSVRVKPSNYPGRWATNDDYPPDDFVRKNEGISTFLLIVGTDGAVTACRTIGSSGFPSLDKRTCELLLARAAFHPAKDSNGRPAASFYVNKVWWKVPR